MYHFRKSPKPLLTINPPGVAHFSPASVWWLVKRSLWEDSRRLPIWAWGLDWDCFYQALP